ncbi:hypothetical protein NC651_013655 [Populus alba x Populus x berolinensis]|nr:hypothetical protein NC651_013655 [Populus alba x Populus x berolinensis]
MSRSFLFQNGAKAGEMSPDISFNGFKSGMVPPNVMPGMLKTASDMMSKMSPEKLQKIYTASTINTDGSSPGAGAKPTETRGNFAVNRIDGISGTSSSSFPASTSDMQEQMRDQMKDPAMQQIFTSMMKNMSTEMMANMNVAKAQQAMSSLSLEDLDKMMRWADMI